MDGYRITHVKEWWNDGDDTIDKVKSHYTEDIDQVSRYILMDSQAGPIGYFQFYIVSDDTVGIDQFIGEPNLINMGVGTTAVSAFVELIQTKKNPKSVIVDPSPKNHRAIRCYEKSGFVFENIIVKEMNEKAYIMRKQLIA